MDNIVSVYIEGEDGFNSKSARDKFKAHVKVSQDLELAKKFIKPEYKIELVEKKDNYLKYSVNKIKNTNTNTDSNLAKKNLLKSKLKILSDSRTNINVRNLSLNKDIVPEEISNAYRKLMKISKVPVPEPKEILSNVEMHKPLVMNVLQNNLVSKLSINHPYCTYFTLLAKHMKIGSEFKIPENILNAVSNQTNKSDTLETIVDNNTTESDDSD